MNSPKEDALKEDRILERLENEFSQFKKEHKIIPTLDELDKAFFIREHILSRGWVGTSLGRSLCYQIVNSFNGWMNYLLSIVMPNAGSMVQMNESQSFTEDDKKEIIKLMNRILAVTTQNAIVSLSKDATAESKFINDSWTLWKTIHPEFLRYTKKSLEHWKKEAHLYKVTKE
jgi:hypothetical protein